MKLLRILPNGSLWNIRNASNIHKKKSRSKISLAPKFLDTVKQWPGLLEAEKKAQYEKLDELIKSKTNWQIIEERGHCKGNLALTNIYSDPIQGQIAVFSGEGIGKTGKWLKIGTPVTLNKLDESETLKGISDGHVVSCTKGLLKICVYNTKHVDFSSSNYIVTPSANSGTIAYIQKLLSKKETLSGDSVHLVNLAYRSITLPSIHDRLIKSLPDTLNESQCAAVSAALNTKRNLLCIQGPPGTGKTRVIAEIVHHLAMKKKKVLVCAPTHVAVRNAMEATARRMEEHISKEQIAEQVCILNSNRDDVQQHPRYAELENIHKRLTTMPRDSPFYRAIAAESYKLQSAIFKDFFNPRRAIFTTLGTSSIQKLKEYDWKADVMLVDEAAQCTEPATWVPVLTTPSCKKLVLVGDQKQLPAVVLSEEARKSSLQVSLMEKLAKEFASTNMNVLLKEQFRMNEKIMRWSNEVFYEDQLSSHESVKDITLSDICPNLAHDHVLNNPIFMINMEFDKDRTREELNTVSYTNQDEAKMVADYVQRLVVEVGLDAKKIAVIAPYYAQIEQLRRSIGFYVDVNTVDAFQGHEREVVIFCLVRDNKEGSIGFLNETRRLNVAITRAKRQFVLVGSAQMMKRNGHLKKLLSQLQSESMVFGPEILQSSEHLGLPQSSKSRKYIDF